MVLLCCAPGESPLEKTSVPLFSTYDGIWARAGAATAKHPPARTTAAQMQLPSMDLGLIVSGPWGKAERSSSERTKRKAKTNPRGKASLPGVRVWRYRDYNKRSRRECTCPMVLFIADVSFPPASAKSGLPPPEPPTILA